MGRRGEKVLLLGLESGTEGSQVLGSHQRRVTSTTQVHLHPSMQPPLTKCPLHALVNGSTVAQHGQGYAPKPCNVKPQNGVVSTP